MSGLHVLIIDDSLTDSRIFTALLEKKGYRVSVACNGQEGIEVAKARQPDIILMDVVMPLLNGFQATRELTRAKETSHIPIVVCSSKSGETDRVWALRQGAKAYLTKPVEPKVLLETLTQFATKAGRHG
ncbi:MAG: response regulator [Candidatus Thiothrix putei]|jgi:Response regulators consisting of a CheY-like receiver domain and a winged-helix DNA-binding domain|uniref:Twitching motility two-component system response regulator PilH n=2 Tax=Thiothrix TaxID=1030 RepID=A0A1H3XGV5_9GAMM|nr:response regulator [Thiothrix caldifontis]WGZ94704.1 MAG: response regulator [Candidatus Thiothrix putei]SDZ98171.1 twitching motility two-component system response regulator PilH [Thiothrix caldifontis]